MKPRSEAARILAGYGVTVSELARRTGRSRQAVSRHLAGQTADFPAWLWDTICDMLYDMPDIDEYEDRIADKAMKAAYEARQERRNE